MLPGHSLPPLLGVQAGALLLVIATVSNLNADGTVDVISEEFPEELMTCLVLVTGDDRHLSLRSGDAVLLSLRSHDRQQGVILGRVDRYLPPANEERTKADNAVGHAVPAPALTPAAHHPRPVTPTSLVLEATQELTLRVGDGSITIRRDGKILIKGKDLVSHAQRVNRIKGGSVSIN